MEKLIRNHKIVKKDVDLIVSFNDDEVFLKVPKGREIARITYEISQKGKDKYTLNDLHSITEFLTKEIMGVETNFEEIEKVK